MLTPVSMAQHDCQCSSISFQLFWPYTCNGVTHNALASHDASSNGVTWPKNKVTPYFDHLNLMNKIVPFTMPSASHDQKWHVTINFNHLDLKKQWCHWWCHWHHLMLVPVVSHDQENEIACHFNHVDLANAVVPLKTSLASFDTGTSTSGVSWSKPYWTSF